MKKQLSAKELRLRYLRTKSVADSGKLDHITAMKLQTQARLTLKTLHGAPYGGTGSTIEDFMDGLNSAQKIYKEHQKEAFKEANGNAEKQVYLYQERIALDEDIAKLNADELEMWDTKIFLEYEPIFIDLEKLEETQKFFFRDVKEYKFDLNLVFSEPIKVEYRGSELIRKPYQDFMDLEIDGFIFTNKKAYEKALKDREEGEDAEEDSSDNILKLDASINAAAAKRSSQTKNKKQNGSK